MVTELTYVAWCAVLLLILWIPYIVGSVSTGGFLRAEEYKTPLERESPDWLRRCNRAHVNLVENFAPFAALVIVGHLTDQLTAATATAAMIFFWSRVIHAVVYIMGIPYLRTIFFSISTFASLFIAWEVLT